MALPSLSRMAYFYPRPPRGGRPRVVLIINQFVIISIHALREEGDLWQTLAVTASCYFYPRPPRGGRRASSNLLYAGTYFYPRPPRGGRLL